MTSHNLTDIFLYKDFRKFLKEYQIKRNKFDKKFSKKYICEKLGIPNSTSYFNLVLTGRFVSDDYINRFITALELNQQQALYFRLLVAYDQTNDQEKRHYLYRQIVTYSLPSESNGSGNIDAKQDTRDLSDWFYPIICSIIDRYRIKDINELLIKLENPSINKQFIEESIAKLIKEKIITRDNAGKFSVLNNKYLLKNYNHTMTLDLMKYCVENTIKKVENKILPKRTKNILSFFLSQESYDEVKNLLYRFQKDIQAISKNDIKNHPKKIYSQFYQLKLLSKSASIDQTQEHN